MEVKAASKANFKELVLDSDKLTIVDFWAPWCGHCVRMMPIYEELAAEMPEVNFVKVNTDEEMELAQEYKIELLPTFAVFKNGEIVDRKLASFPKSEFVAFIEKNR